MKRDTNLHPCYGVPSFLLDRNNSGAHNLQRHWGRGHRRAEHHPQPRGYQVDGLAMRRGGQRHGVDRYYLQQDELGAWAMRQDSYLCHCRILIHIVRLLNVVEGKPIGILPDLRVWDLASALRSPVRRPRRSGLVRARFHRGLWTRSRPPCSSRSNCSTTSEVSLIFIHFTTFENYFSILISHLFMSTSCWVGTS